MNVDNIAETCHEANRALQRQNGEQVSPPWAASPPWVQDSARAGVLSAINGATPEELHQAWSDHKYAEGWGYGPQKDGIAKTHPCLVPYADLPETQRIKDRVFGAIVVAMVAS